MRANIDPTHEQPAQVSSFGILAARLFWMLLGPLLLLVLLYGIAATGHGWTTRWDGLYALVLVAIIASRWLEVHSGAAMTATGEPATMTHFRRYVYVLLPVAIGAWLVANLVGNNVLRRG